MLWLCLQVIPGSTTSKDVIKKHRKSLNDLYIDQCARYPEEMECVQPPRTANVSSVLASLGRLKAVKSKDRHEDPGKNHLTNTRLTAAQLEIISSYGVTDSAPKPRTFAYDVGSELHFTVTSGLTMLLRSDTVLSIKLPNLFVMPCPGLPGLQPCTLLCICTDDVSYLHKSNIHLHMACWLYVCYCAAAFILLNRAKPTLTATGTPRAPYVTETPPYSAFIFPLHCCCLCAG